MKRKKVTQTHKAEHHQDIQRAARPKVSAPHPAHPLKHLHQTLGNRAVGHLMQAKLRIGQPGDRYEREADRVADMAMRMPRAQTTKSEVVQCQEAETAKADEEDEIQSKRAEVSLLQHQAEEEGLVQTKGGSQRGQALADGIVSSIQAMKAHGQPLPKSTRELMESRFGGYDFGDVRIYADALAAESARTIDAKAYTVGRDIVFSPGKYTPTTTSGRILLAHELAHVVQQKKSPTQSAARIQFAGQKTPKTKKPPWTQRDLEVWLREDLKALRKKIDECDTWYTFRSRCKAEHRFEIRKAKGIYRLGMQLLRMVENGHTNPPHDSPTWEVLNNPDGLSPRALLQRVYRVMRARMFGPGSLWGDAAGSGEGGRIAEERNKKRLQEDPYYRYTEGPSHPKDDKYVADIEKEIIDKQVEGPEVSHVPKQHTAPKETGEEPEPIKDTNKRRRLVQSKSKRTLVHTRASVPERGMPDASALERHAGRATRGFRRTIFRHINEMYKRRTYLSELSARSSKHDTLQLDLGVKQITRDAFKRYIATGTVVDLKNKVSSIDQLRELRDYLLVRMPHAEDVRELDIVELRELEQLLLKYTIWRLDFICKKAGLKGYGIIVFPEEEIERVPETGRKIIEYYERESGSPFR
ncbi:MAG: DUF4157 domain-containing protein [Planctomycetes bacterium]|nr:DUF4157 domain-containing protein [Planctomycetota bacterium]MBL7186545.1 DUF4157 domain-containing protein [Phycisphaerae bacterium]